MATASRLLKMFVWFIDPVIVHMEMETIDCRWNHNGTILAVVGMLTEGEKEVNVVQFYSSYGEVLQIHIVIQQLCKKEYNYS